MFQRYHHIKFVFLLCCFCLASVAANADARDSESDIIHDKLRDSAVAVLRQALNEEHEWVKVHAAEALLWNGYPGDVKEAFLAEDETAGPKYRIGVWRVLAQAQGNDVVTRKRYVDKIRDAFLDTNGPDRLHALETLAKLQYSERTDEVLRVAKEEKGEFQAYARWVLANSGNASDEAALADLLDSTDPTTRLIVAYALRHLKRIQPSTLSKLGVVTLNEPVDSVARVYLLSAWYVHSPKDKKEVVEKELLKYVQTGNKDQKYEVCAALGYSGDKLHNPLLEKLLEDSEMDVRGSAAHALLRIDRRQVRGLKGLDWTIIALYGILMLGIGWFCSRKQKNTEEYFVGSRNMSPFVIGISLLATLLSTISYLAYPGEIIKHGPVILYELAAIPIVYLIVGYALIPVFMKLPITSAYEILERRLGIKVRLLGSVIFIVVRLIWMALLIYVGAKAVVVLLGWAPQTLPYVVIISGLISVAYTTVGGLRADVITDIYQFFVLLGGAIATIVVISVEMGGVRAWWPTSWAPNWDVQPFFSFNPHVRVTVVGSLIAATTWWICTAGSDQMVIQRYLATRDVRAARRAFLINSGAAVVVVLLLAIVGFALLGFFRLHPEYLPDGQTLIGGADQLFPHYIANYIPIGITGFVVTALFAAAMSSLDSGVNSITNVFITDFLDRFRKRKDTERHHVKMAKYFAFGIGTAVVLISSVIGKVPGNINEVTNKVNGLFVGPLFGFFFMALFIPFSTPFGAIFGALYGFVASVLIAFWDVLTGRPGLSFQWILVTSLLVNIIAGSLLSLIPTRGRNWRIVTAWSVLATIPLVIIVLSLVY